MATVSFNVTSEDAKVILALLKSAKKVHGFNVSPVQLTEDLAELPLARINRLIEVIEPFT